MTPVTPDWISALNVAIDSNLFVEGENTIALEGFGTSGPFHNVALDLALTTVPGGNDWTDWHGHAGLRPSSLAGALILTAAVVSVLIRLRRTINPSWLFAQLIPMKKYILAALLVTFVRPGFGQCLHPAASPAAAQPAPASPYPLKQTEQNSHNGNQFILVKLQMIEVSLTKLAGVSSERYGGGKGMSALELLTKLESTGGVNRSSAPDLGKLAGFIEALPKDSLAKPLAEPSLMVEPKKPAYCFVGGAIGCRVKDAAGKESVEYKEYGTRTDVVAIVLADNRIHLDVRLRVSQLDPKNNIPAGKNSVPAITCREAESGLTLRSSEKVVLGGLIESRDEAVNQTGEGGKSKIVHVANRVESFVLVQATLVPNEKTGAASDKAGRTANSSNGPARR